MNITPSVARSSNAPHSVEFACMPWLLSVEPIQAAASQAQLLPSSAFPPAVQAAKPPSISITR